MPFLPVLGIFEGSEFQDLFLNHTRIFQLEMTELSSESGQFKKLHILFQLYYILEKKTMGQ